MENDTDKHAREYIERYYVGFCEWVPEAER